MNYNSQPSSMFDNDNNGQNYVNESFSMDYADTYQKELFVEDNNLNETILEQKMRKGNNYNPNENLNFINQYNCGNDGLNILNQDRKQGDYLQVRKYPQFTQNEFIHIKKSVGKDLLNIQNYLLVRLNDYNVMNANKKIGPILPLTYLIENHYEKKPQNKKLMQEKYDRLKYYICNYRPNYGDGNCFYRAVMFRYIELLILYKKTDILKSLIVDIHRSFETSEVKQRLFIKDEYLNPNLIVQIMITILELIESDRLLDAHFAFYKAILFCKIFDYSLILYLRYILYSYIKQNEKKLYTESFPVLIGNLLPLKYEKDDYFYFEPFYENNLLKMFCYPEKINIYLTPFVLGINFSMILFDDKEKEIVKDFGFEGRNYLNIDESLSLLFRGGKFENIFSFEDNEKYKFIYEHYINNVKPSFIKIDDSLKNQTALLKSIYNKNFAKNQAINNAQQNKGYDSNEIKSQVIPKVQNSIYNNNFNNNGPKQYNTIYGSVIVNNKKNGNLFNSNNDNEKSYEAFTCYNGNYTYQEQNQQKQMNNNQNYFNGECNNQTSAYCNDNQNNMGNNILFEHNQNVNSCPPNLNNMNINNNMYNNMDNNMNNNMDNNMYNNPNMYNNMNDNMNNNMNNNINNNMYNNTNMNYNINNNMYNNNMYNNNMNNNNEQGFFNNQGQNGNNSNPPVICVKCNSINSGLKNISNICPNCLRGEIINQSRNYYIDYLRNITRLEKANSVTKKDFEELFLKRIIINLDGNNYNIFKAIDEFNCKGSNIKFDFNRILKEILVEIKKGICLYCFNPVQSPEFLLPCGCNFCCYQHITSFFNEKVQNKLTHNYKCFCSFKYKPHKVFQLCNYLVNLKIYRDYNFYINNLNAIFGGICCKCGLEKRGMQPFNIEGICPVKFNHFICDECRQKGNSNYAKCIICNNQNNNC